jgi:hypothetical protein
MPKITAHADIFRDWDAVLGACTQNAGLLPGVDPFKGELVAMLTQAQDLKIQQESLEGQRKAVTQQLERTLEGGKEWARKLRAFAVVHLGTDNKALTQFGVRPRQRRGSRKAKPPGVPTVGAAAAPAAGQTESSPQGKEGAHG